MSDWYQIESNQIILQVLSRGAEMKRLFNKAWNKELLWSGDPKVWNRTAPILFPIVGNLKNNEYEYLGNKFNLPRHGFARDCEFICIKCGDDEIEFYLGTSKDTYKMFPFIFDLKVKYTLSDTVLTIENTVKNMDQKDMFFSIGAHPAFDTFPIENFELEFEKKEDYFYLLNNGLVDEKLKFPFKENKLELAPKNFEKDALIFEAPKSSFVNLFDKKTKHLIKVRFQRPSYLGIWGKENLPFICIEPWNGVGDFETHDGKLENKVGIIKLSPNEHYTFKYEIDFQVRT